MRSLEQLKKQRQDEKQDLVPQDNHNDAKDHHDDHPSHHETCELKKTSMRTSCLFDAITDNMEGSGFLSDLPLYHVVRTIFRARAFSEQPA